MPTNNAINVKIQSINWMFMKYCKEIVNIDRDDASKMHLLVFLYDCNYLDSLKVLMMLGKMILIIFKIIKIAL